MAKMPGVYVVGTVTDLETKEGVGKNGDAWAFHNVWVSVGRDTVLTVGTDSGYKLGQTVEFRCVAKEGYRGGVEFSRIVDASASEISA